MAMMEHFNIVHSLFLSLYPILPSILPEIFENKTIHEPILLFLYVIILCAFFRYHLMNNVKRSALLNYQKARFSWWSWTIFVFNLINATQIDTLTSIVHEDAPIFSATLKSNESLCKIIFISLACALSFLFVQYYRVFYQRCLKI